MIVVLVVVWELEIFGIEDGDVDFVVFDCGVDCGVEWLLIMYGCIVFCW